MNAHRAACPHEPTDTVHQRRLPGAVRADQPDDLVGAHGEGHAVDGDDASEANREFDDLERRDAVRGRRALGPSQDRRRGDATISWYRRAFRRRPREQAVPRRVGDLDEATREVEEEHEETETRGEQRDQLVVGEERRHPDDPQCADDRTHRRGDPADHHDGHQLE